MTYAISRVNRHELRYMHGKRTLTVEVESGFERLIEEPIGAEHLQLINLVVYTSAIQQWDSGEPISSEERQRIAQNISEALTTAGTKHVLA